MTTSLLINSNGGALEPENGVVAAGSGGPQAAALTLINHRTLSAQNIVREALAIAGPHLHLHQQKSDHYSLEGRCLGRN